MSKRLDLFAGASPLKQLLLRVAVDSRTSGRGVARGLVSWLSEITGKVVDGHRLEKATPNRCRCLRPSGFMRRIEERS